MYEEHLNVNPTPKIKNVYRLEGKRLALKRNPNYFAGVAKVATCF